jgi:hypothetical protein
MKEDLTFVVDSLGVARPEKIIEAPSHSLPELFAQGGMGGMILITVLLVCLLLAAWKAPRWVKESASAPLSSLFSSLCSVWLKHATRSK